MFNFGNRLLCQFSSNILPINELFLDGALLTSQKLANKKMNKLTNIIVEGVVKLKNVKGGGGFHGQSGSQNFRFL